MLKAGGAWARTRKNNMQGYCFTKLILFPLYYNNTLIKLYNTLLI